MIGKMTILATDGTETVVEFDRQPTNDELGKAVGGYLQIVPLFGIFRGVECVAFCNDEGKNAGLAHNAVASGYWTAAARHELNNDRAALDDVLVGPVVVITGDDEFMGGL